MKENYCLLVSSCNSGINKGGLSIINSDYTVDVIDNVSTTGLAVSEEAVFRAIQKISYLELVVYKANEVKQYFYSKITDIHDLYFDNGHLYAVATGSNEVYRLSKELKIDHVYKFEGTGDSWHLNCMDKIGDKLYCSAFCDYFQHYNYKNNATGKGFLIGLEDNDRLITGLSQPHSPFSFDEKIYICNSENKSLLIKDFHDNILEEIVLGNYTRGLYVDDSYIYIGLSKSRDVNSLEKSSRVLVLDRNTLQVVTEVMIPFDEIYDIKLIPNSFKSILLSYKYKKTLINGTRIKVKAKKFMSKFIGRR